MIISVRTNLSHLVHVATPANFVHVCHPTVTSLVVWPTYSVSSSRKHLSPFGSTSPLSPFISLIGSPELSMAFSGTILRKRNSGRPLASRPLVLNQPLLMFPPLAMNAGSRVSVSCALGFPQISLDFCFPSSLYYSALDYLHHYKYLWLRKNVMFFLKLSS